MMKCAASAAAAAAVVLCLLASSATASGANPALNKRLTSTGLRNIARIVSGLSNRTASEQKRLPDVNFNKFVDFSFTNLVVTFAPHPMDIDANFVSNRGIRVRTTLADIEIKGSWRFASRGWFRMQYNGAFDIIVSQVSMDVLFNIGKSARGGIRVTAPECQATASYKVDLGSSFYNLLFRFVKGFLHNQMQSLICKTAVEMIQNHRLLKTLENAGNLTFFGILLDVSLLDPPKFTDDYMETNVKGIVYWQWKGKIITVPFSPKPMGILNTNTKMVYLQMSEYIVNSIMYRNFMKGLYTETNFPGHADFLRTTCKEPNSVCIGKIIPELSSKYPNYQISLSSVALAPPHVFIEDGLRMTVNSSVRFGIDFTNGTKVKLFAVNLYRELKYNLSIENSKLHMKIIDAGKASVETVIRKSFSVTQQGNALISHIYKNEMQNLFRVIQQNFLDAAKRHEWFDIQYVFEGLQAVGLRASRLELNNMEVRVAGHSVNFGTDFRIY